MSARLSRLRSLLADRGLDGVLITDPANRFYLSGYTAEDHAPGDSAGVLLIGQDVATLLTSANNLDWAASEATDFQVRRWTRPWTATVVEDIREYGWKRVGFEDAAILFSTHRDVASGLNGAAELVPIGDGVSRLRSVKEDEELRAIERALAIGDQVFAQVASWLRPGLTERAVAREVECLVREAGADGLSFPPSVAAGPHAARPHHRPTERPLREGEPVIIDLGARVGGYAGDLTRTVWLGAPDERLRAVYNVVWSAQAAAIADLRAGIAASQADWAARRVVESAGHGTHFVHGLGHGLGIRVHEAPSLSATAIDALQPGEVVTVEPGIYVPGWGGVRIEDVVVIEEMGCRVLTRAPKLSPV